MKRKTKNQKTTVRIGLVQMTAGADPDQNLGRAIRAVRQVASKGAQIISLQELFRSLYFPQQEDTRAFALAETIPGPSSRALSNLAKELEVVIVASLFEKRTEGIYHNTAVVIDADGSMLGKYRKMHIPDDPCYFEKFYFTPGDLGFQSFSTRYAKVGVLICWDQWFPEAARLVALSGAEILFYPTAIGWLSRERPEMRETQRSAWELIQRSHGVANGIFVAAINRVGTEGKIQFWGNSFVSGPLGQVLAKADSKKEEVLLADCDLNLVRETREGWPFLRDRRIDAYQDLSNRFFDESNTKELNV